MPVVSSELWVGTLERWVLVGSRLLDTITAQSALACYTDVSSSEGSSCMLKCMRDPPWVCNQGSVRTRSCGSSSPGYAATSSLILVTLSADIGKMMIVVYSLAIAMGYCAMICDGDAARI